MSLFPNIESSSFINRPSSLGSYLTNHFTISRRPSPAPETQRSYFLERLFFLSFFCFKKKTAACVLSFTVCGSCFGASGSVFLKFSIISSPGSSSASPSACCGAGLQRPMLCCLAGTYVRGPIPATVAVRRMLPKLPDVGGVRGTERLLPSNEVYLSLKIGRPARDCVLDCEGVEDALVRKCSVLAMSLTSY